MRYILVIKCQVYFGLSDRETHSHLNTVLAMTDDTFDLYDLRVEVVCPPGGRILCGAKDGDYFTLEGELLRMPEGQGFSIYSLGQLKTRLNTPN
jgi:hypothetical protein